MSAPSPTTPRLLDELHIHLVPVLLGQGIRLFEQMGPVPIDGQGVDDLDLLTNGVWNVRAR
jgi:hypothetical protein